MSRFLVAILAAFVAAASAAQTTRIELREVVRGLKSGEPVRLFEVARIDGELSGRLEELVVAENLEDLPTTASGWATLSSETVRTAIEIALPRHLEHVVVRGADPLLRVPIAISTKPEEKAEPTNETVAEAQTPTAAELDLGTIRARVALAIAGSLGIAPPDLRIGFEPEDDDLLGRHPAGLHVETRPKGVGEIMPMDIVLYDRDRIVESRTVRARIAIRREVTVPLSYIRRGDVMTADDVRSSVRWVPPDLDPAPRAEILGRVAAARLEKGDPIERNELEEALVIRRGDAVSLRVRAGGITVSREGRAAGDARRGEMVPIELPGSRERVTARAAAPGIAVAEERRTAPEGLR